MDRNTLKASTLAAIAGTVLLWAPLEQARAELNLSDVPLVVNSRVAPNVFFEVDDSGSMDFEVLMRPYWHYCAYDPEALDEQGSDDCGGSDLIRDGRWDAEPEGSGNEEYIYLFVNDDNTYGNDCTPNSRNGNAGDCGALPEGGVRPDLEGEAFIELDWRNRSADTNITWFNGDQTYEPWAGYPDADFSNARSHPDSARGGYDDIRDLDGFVWYEWHDTHGYSGDRPRRGDNENRTPEGNEQADLWDDHTRYEVSGDAINVVRYTVDINNNGELSRSVVESRTIGGDEAARYKQNIANWYQYHRRRSFVAKNAIADVINSSPGYRYGLSVLNRDEDLFIEVPAAMSGDFSAHDEALIDALFEFEQPSAGTPLRQALDKVGEYYAGERGGTRDPIVAACQKNFTVLFTDGFWNGSTPSGIGDADGDGYSVTVADVARHYYEQDLSGLPDEVPPDDFDTATYQHMNTFTVAFGLEGLLTDTDGDGWPNPPLDVSDDWGDATDPGSGGESPTRVDDLWHAAWNGRGQYINAQSPQAVSEGLREALGNIRARTSSSSALASNSTSTRTSQAIYQGRFDSGSWVGELLALPLTGTDVGEPIWNAADELPDPADRDIFTVGPGASEADGDAVLTGGRAFSSFTSLSPSQQTALNANGTDDRGAERLAYLRGDQSSEGQGDSDFRQRLGLLGDIVNSDPQFVAAEDFGYSRLPGTEGSSYRSFLQDKQDRAEMVYVGANDGMLHGFNAESGREELAYIPNAVFPNLAALTDPDYSHRFYVDGSPRVADAHLSSGWATVLAGTTGYGGRSVFALDVTDPEGFGANDVLWEFTHPELGRTIGQPAVVRLEDGTWAAVLGNGYNSDSHEASLFVVPLDDPGNYTRLATDGAGSVSDPNGLAAPLALDTNGNGSADVIYAGDLHGRMWRFDVSEGLSGPGERLFTATGPAVGRQPITVKPQAAFDSDRTLHIYFGTGQYLEEEDAVTPDNPRIESFYAIKDEGSSTTRAQLVEQRIIAEQAIEQEDGSSTLFRFFSDEPVADGDDGWFVDLAFEGNALGERVVNDFIVRDERVIFTSIIPRDDPCGFGGTSWLNELDAFSGGEVSFPVFDVNGDGEIDAEDVQQLVEGGPGRNAGGRSLDGLVDSPAIVPYRPDGDDQPADGELELKVVSGSTGIPVTVLERNSASGGRVSWQELR